MQCVGCKTQDLEAAFCVACAKKLRDEIERLEGQVGMQKAWARSFYNDRERLKAELERLRANEQPQS